MRELEKKLEKLSTEELRNFLTRAEKEDMLIALVIQQELERREVKEPQTKEVRIGIPVPPLPQDLLPPPPPPLPEPKSITELKPTPPIEEKKTEPTITPFESLLEPEEKTLDELLEEVETKLVEINDAEKLRELMKTFWRLRTIVSEKIEAT